MLTCIRLLVLLGSLAIFTTTAWAEVELEFGGKLQTDVRFRIEKKSMGSFYNSLELPVGVARNQNMLKGKLNARAGAFTGVVDLDFVWIGYSTGIEGVGDLGLREKVDPYRLKVHALYLEGTDLGVEGLDLRLGQQLVMWGKGDQFNPTNNLNASDLDDVLLFGEQVSNLMARLDYTFKDVWTLSGVLVPIFKPAVLPDSAPLGIAAVDRIPFVSDSLRHRIEAEKGFVAADLKTPTVVTKAVPVLPETSLENMQYMFRFAGTVVEQDIALSYYNGRTDFPQPFLNYARVRPGRLCDPLSGECVDNLLDTEVYLNYPRVQVVGLNAAGQVDALGWLSSKIKPIGYRLEVGVYFPQAANMVVLQDKIFIQPAGEYTYYKGYKLGMERPLIVEDTPFAKWTVGLDYTFNRYVYMNVQWVHGMADDYGAGDFFHEGWAVRQSSAEGPSKATCAFLQDQAACDQAAREILRPRLGDYLVLGVDLKFNEDKGLFRLFTIWDLSGVTEDYYSPTENRRVRDHYSLFTSKGFSAVIYPELNYNFGNGLELAVGALLELGKSYTKFGDPASGGSLVWTRGKFSY